MLKSASFSQHPTYYGISRKSLQFGWVGVGVGGSANVDTTAKCNIVTNSD